MIEIPTILRHFEAEDVTIYVRDVRHHRNGVFGEGFYAVHFQFDDEGTVRELVGIMFGFNPETPETSDWRRRTAVINAADPSSKWRGDEFAPVLYDTVMWADANRSAYR